MVCLVIQDSQGQLRSVETKVDENYTIFDLLGGADTTFVYYQDLSTDNNDTETIICGLAPVEEREPGEEGVVHVRRSDDNDELPAFIIYVKLVGDASVPADLDIHELTACLDRYPGTIPENV